MIHGKKVLNGAGESDSLGTAVYIYLGLHTFPQNTGYKTCIRSFINFAIYT
jgi:hypothetical protein